MLLSGSSDGLICTSNADEEDEDEALLHVGNWGCGVSQAGWISVSAGAQAWAGSDMETFSCWSDEVGLGLSCPPCTRFDGSTSSWTYYKIKTSESLRFTIRD